MQEHTQPARGRAVAQRGEAGLRRKMGATLSLVACCTLIVIAFGIAMWFLITFIGGSGEVSHGTDSGALNTAKQALFAPSVDVMALDAQEFTRLGENGSNKLSLLTYNRAVAATMLMLLNEKDLPPNSKLGGNGAKVIAVLDRVAKALADQLKSGPELSKAFDNLSSAQRVSMLGAGNPLLRNGIITCAWMKPGGSTNVYFDPETLPDLTDLTKYLNTDAAYKHAKNGQPFLKGYVELLAPGVYGTPVCPGTTPHLVTNDDFIKAMSPAIAALQNFPPNSFSGKANSTQIRFQLTVGAMSSAIVGTLTREYPGGVPGGYLKFVNGPGEDLPANWKIIYTDGANDIFNKELYAPGAIRGGGIAQAENKVFCNSLDQMMELITEAKRNQANIANGLPPVDFTRFTKPPYDFRFGNALKQKADKDTLASCLDLECHCYHLKYDGTLKRPTPPLPFYWDDRPGALFNVPSPDPCVVNVPKWADNYGRDVAGDIAKGKANPITDRKNYTAVEYMRAGILATRAVIDDYEYTMHEKIHIKGPKDPTGMKAFDRNAPLYLKTYGLKLKDSTPWALVQSFASVTPGPETIKGIIRRAKQIAVGLSNAQLQALLDSKGLPPNSTLYLYNDDFGKPILTSAPPPRQDASVEADARLSPINADVAFDANGKAVNVFNDIGFNDRAYSGINKPEPPGPIPYPPPPNVGKVMVTDRLKWEPGTGYRNFMGTCEFEETIDTISVCQSN